MKRLNPPSLSQILTSARRWTKGALGRSNDGVAVYQDDRLAVRFCLIGAAALAAGNLYGTSARQIRRKLFNALPLRWKPLHWKNPEDTLDSTRWATLVAFNNDPKTKFADIRKLLRRARV